MTEIDLTPITRLEYDIDAILNDHAVAEPITRIELILADIVAGNTTTVEPVTRIETYLAIISGADYPVPEPVTRIETFLAIIAGEDYEEPEAVTRLEGLLAEWVEKGSGIWKTATGTLIHLTDALASPMRKCEVSLEPIQSGSGDPSPTNVRPITGWTGCEVWVKDEYDTSLPATASVTFPDSTGTVYGGTVDFVTGDGEITQVKWIENGSRQPYIAVWTQGDDYNCTLFDTFSAASGLRQADFAGNENKFICNNRRFVNINGNDKTLANTFASYRASGSYSFCYSIPKTLTTKAEIAAWFAENPSEVVYLLQKPIPFHVDPQQISTLKDVNNVWGDGTIELTYKAQAE